MPPHVRPPQTPMPPMPGGMLPPPQIPPHPPAIASGNNNIMQAGFNQYYQPAGAVQMPQGQNQNPDDMAKAAYDAQFGQGASDKAGIDTVRNWMKEKCGGDPGQGKIPEQINPTMPTSQEYYAATGGALPPSPVQGNPPLTLPLQQDTPPLPPKNYTKKEVKTIQKQMERWSKDYRNIYKKEYKSRFPDKSIRETQMNADAKEYAIQMWNSLHPDEPCPTGLFKS